MTSARARTRCTLGVEATAHILEGLRKRVARNELADVDALLTALGEAMTDILMPVQRALVIDPAIKPFVILVRERQRHIIDGAQIERGTRRDAPVRDGGIGARFTLVYVFHSRRLREEE